MELTRNHHLFLTTIVYFHYVRYTAAQGMDVGPADPLKIGQIDPVSLEVASTYVFIVPFVIFVFGILFIPVSLVLLFLFVTPFLVPSGNGEGRRSISSHGQLFHQGLFSSPTSAHLEQENALATYKALVNNILSAIQSQGQQL